MLQQHSKHLNKSTNKPILTVYQLFHSCIPIQPHPCLLWQARCSWSNWLTWERLYPQDAIANDYPIHIEIKYILDLLHLIISTFYHMKGHEDEKHTNHKCSQKVSIWTVIKGHQNFQTILYQNNPCTTHNYQHLLITNETIIWQTQHHLKDAATNSWYQQYCKTNSDGPSDSIDYPLENTCISPTMIESCRKTNYLQIHPWVASTPWQISHLQ